MTTNTSVTRFNLIRRIEHLTLLISFSTLGLTGLIQKYSQAGVSQFLIALLGGIELVRIIHRIAATIFVLEAVFHVIYAIYVLYVQKLSASMLPGLKDGKDVVQFILHNLNLKKEAPKMGRYNFMEKMEYWAVIWGLILMGLTGFMLWNPVATTRFLPGQFIPAAKVAHGMEAVLAVLAIIIWHFYNVHLKSWNSSIWNGKMSRQHMEEEHGAELAEIDNDAVAKSLPAAEQKKRLRLFIPISVLIAVIGLGFTYWFVSFEDTALAYVPPEPGTVRVYERQTPTPAPTAEPTPTAAPTTAGSTGAATWDGGIGAIFSAKCGACHGAAGGLNLKSYADAMKGAKVGPVIIPGNADGSLVVTTVSGGTHPGKFTAGELEQIKAWILAGALEK